MHRTWLVAYAGTNARCPSMNPICNSFVELGSILWTQKCHTQLKSKILIEANILKFTEHFTLYASVHTFLNDLERNSVAFTIDLRQLSQEIISLPNSTNCLLRAIERIYLLKYRTNIIMDMPNAKIMLHHEILLIRCPQLIEHKALLSE